MVNLKKEIIIRFLLISCILALCTAVIIQYVFGYQPCNLCLIERVPYILAIIILLLNYKFHKHKVFWNILLLLIFSFSFLISVYHLGIEQDLFKESSLCSSKNVGLITKEDVLKSLENLNISCKDVAFKIFGLSLTTYNIFLSIIMLLLSTKIYFINNDIKKESRRIY